MSHQNHYTYSINTHIILVQQHIQTKSMFCSRIYWCLLHQSNAVWL